MQKKVEEITEYLKKRQNNTFPDRKGENSPN